MDGQALTDSLERPLLPHPDTTTQHGPDRQQPRLLPHAALQRHPRALLLRRPLGRRLDGALSFNRASNPFTHPPTHSPKLTEPHQPTLPPTHLTTPPPPPRNDARRTAGRGLDRRAPGPRRRRAPAPRPPLPPGGAARARPAAAAAGPARAGGGGGGGRRGGGGGGGGGGRAPGPGGGGVGSEQRAGRLLPLRPSVICDGWRDVCTERARGAASDARTHTHTYIL